MAGHAHFHSPRLPGIAAQIPLLLKDGKLMGDAGLACKSDRLSDLPHRRCIAVPYHPLPDDLEYLPLPPSEHVIGIPLARHAHLLSRVTTDHFLLLRHACSFATLGVSLHLITLPGTF
jgi:hypothetical protein